MNEIQSIVNNNIDSITKGENPEGKCDDWNGCMLVKVKNLTTNQQQSSI